jgi:hypothetical protein
MHIVDNKCVVLINKQHYDKLISIVYGLQPVMQSRPLPTSPFSTANYRKPVYDEDINRYLEDHHATLGNEIKKYNPYSWHRELIFDSEEYAVLFHLKAF